jgi:BON domain-containing protein
MHHTRQGRTFRTEDDFSPGWRQSRRDAVNDDIAPDDVSLLGPPTGGRHHEPLSPRELGAYGYAGQDYPIYGQAGDAGPGDPAEPGWFGDPASSAYAFGYTTSLHPNDPAAGGHAGHGPRDYLRSDARIREDVCERLTAADDVDATNIVVSVIAGDVILEGHVPDRYMRRQAEDIAASVRGAIDVDNRLDVDKGLFRELGDKLAGEDAKEHHGHQGEGPHGSQRPPP